MQKVIIKRKVFYIMKTFYFLNYLDEDYIMEKISHLDKNKYPSLNKYLQYSKKMKIV